jgi:protein-tyrosine kinase
MTVADPRLDLDLSPGSATLEACRMLRANLLLGMSDELLPPLLLVSGRSDLGCARVAAALAIVLAEECRPTLLVDADLRHPKLHTLFSVRRRPGLADALETGAQPSIVYVRPHLWLLPAGEPRRDPTELLKLPTMASLAQGLAEELESIVYHVPGHLLHPDALLLTACVPSAVLCLRRGVDSADDARMMKESLERSGANLLGFAMLEPTERAWFGRSLLARHAPFWDVSRRGAGAVR